MGDPAILALLPSVPVAGCLSNFPAFWEGTTSNKWVLEVVQKGYFLELLNPLPFNGLLPTKPPRLFAIEMHVKVSDLLQKGAISVLPPNGTREGFYSTYFIVPKKSGGLRPILNLKSFNHCIRKVHFKM